MLDHEPTKANGLNIFEPSKKVATWFSRFWSEKNVEYGIDFRFFIGKSKTLTIDFRFFTGKKNVD